MNILGECSVGGLVWWDGEGMEAEEFIIHGNYMQTK